MDKKEVLYKIGYFFLEQNLEKYAYDKAMEYTYQFLSNLRITDCKKLGDKVFEVTLCKPELLFEVTLCKPELLIGPAGATIASLKKKLNIKIKLKKILWQI